MNLEIDQARLSKELDELAAFTDAPAPAVTRVVFTETDRQGREYVKRLCAEAGLEIREDAAGNTFARWVGTEPQLPAVGTGSHIDAIPNALITLDQDNNICLANSAAESFFQTSSAVLRRLRLTDLVPFSSPVLNTVVQARNSAGAINEYAIAVGTPRHGGERIVDVQTALMTEDPRFVLIMLLERSMAHKIDRQLTSRSAARSVSGMAEMLAHEIKNPLAGIRGAARGDSADPGHCGAKVRLTSGRNTVMKS